MANYIYQNRWLIGLRGVLAIIFGVIAIIAPGVTATALVYLFAGYVLVDGVLTIAASIRNRETNDRWWVGLLEGLVSILAGVAAILMPGMAAVTLVLLIGIWAIITGVLEIIAAVRLRREIENEWALGLSGVVSVIAGVIMIVNPGVGALGIVWVIAGYAIFFGILMIALVVSAGRFAERATGAGVRVYDRK